MSEDRFSQEFYFNSFIKAAQYFSGMAADANIYEEAIQVIIKFFQADLVFFAVQPDGALHVTDSHFEKKEDEQIISPSEEFIEQVLETEFLASEIIALKEERYAVIFLPIVRFNQTVSVLAVGYQDHKPASKGMLNVYLAIAGLISSMLEKQVSQYRFQVMAENVPEALYRLLVSHDRTVKFEYVSKGSAGVLGLSPYVLMHNAASFFQNIHIDDRVAFYRHALKAQKEQNRLSMSFRWQDEASNIRYILINVMPTLLEDGGYVWDGAAQDNTESKLAELEIRTLNEDLTERTVELARANAEITEFNLSLEKKVKERTIELHETLEKVEYANQQIMESIHYAKRIQSSLLSDIEQIQQHLPDSFFLWQPRDIVGGDIFTLEFWADMFLIAVVDCTGHGVPGALMTMLVSAGFKRIIMGEGLRDPAHILQRLNTIVKTTLRQDTDYALSDDGLDAAICLVNPKARRLTFAGARLPLYVAHNGDIKVIKGDRQSIGYKRSNLDFIFTNHDLSLREGMGFYLATDGFRDQAGGKKGYSFGSRRFTKLLQKQSGQPFDRQQAALLQAFKTYQGHYEQRDDVTVVGFRV